MDTENDTAALALAALGHPARLSIFRLLVKAGPDGLLVGEVAAHLDMALSTLAHHLRTLKQAGLILQARRGREVVTRANAAHFRDMMEFVLSECCVGLSPPAAASEASSSEPMSQAPRLFPMETQS